jgi:uncharacterized protein (DUF1697 family)
MRPMPRYAAFLRGVSPMNAKMPELKKCFEDAGFTGVRTLLSSGNVVFGARAAAITALERKAEAAMKQRLGHSFMTLVRPVEALRQLIESDPYRSFRISPQAKRVVTFLRAPPFSKIALPVELDGARILCLKGSEAFSAYERTSRGPVFMTLIQNTFGKDVTTRTWDTVARVTSSPP